MKLIIFGAGASFDSIYKYFSNAEYKNWQPPLGKELFGFNTNFKNILNNYPGAESLVSELLTEDDIEEYFQTKWEFIINHKAPLLLAKIINTQYYLQNLFYSISSRYHNQGTSNYEVIVRAAHDYAIKNNEEVLFLTFNYDLLLEKAIEKELLINFTTIEQYIKPNQLLKLIKPHGSCNWYSRMAPLPIINNVIPISQYLYNYQVTLDKLNIDSEYHIFNNINDINGGANNREIVQAGFPRILIPLKSKDEFIMPQSHHDYLHKSTPNVSDILIIGWKGSEEYFQNFLNNRLANNPIQITAVNCCDTSLEENFNKSLPNKNLKFNHFREPFYFLDEESRPLDFKREGSFSSFILNKAYKEFFV